MTIRTAIFKLFIPVFLFVLTLFVVGKNLGKPFEGIHDWNGARYGNIARNYVRYGFFATKFSQVENSGVVAPPDFVFYTHYPSLLPILISISYRFFGIGEWETRLIPLLVTAGSIVLIFLTSHKIFDWKIGIGASLLALATPMVRYFGKNPVHEPLALFFALLAIYGSLLISTQRKSLRDSHRVSWIGWRLTWVGLIGNFMTNWSGIFLLMGVSLILRSSTRRAITPWIVGALFVLLHFSLVYWATGSIGGGGFLDALRQRTALGGSARLDPFGPLEFILRLRLWFFTMFTASLTLVSLLGLVKIRRESEISKRVYLALLIFGLGYPLILPNATYIHNYFIFGITPFLAISASLGIFRLLKNKYLCFCALLILILFVWFERIDFARALEASKIDSLAVAIGKDINQKVSNKDKVLITPFTYGTSRLPHLTFYSDRIITLDPALSYDWMVKVDEKDGSYTLGSKILNKSED